MAKEVTQEEIDTASEQPDKDKAEKHRRFDDEVKEVTSTKKSRRKTLYDNPRSRSAAETWKTQVGEGRGNLNSIEAQSKED